MLLSLVQLDQEAKPTKTVKYLPLANVIPDPKEGTKCVVAGWGAVSLKKLKMSDVLMSADVAVIKRETCNSPKYYNSNPVITPDMVCAGTLGKKWLKKKKDTCTVGICFFIIYIVNRKAPVACSTSPSEAGSNGKCLITITNIIVPLTQQEGLAGSLICTLVAMAPPTGLSSKLPFVLGYDTDWCNF